MACNDALARRKRSLGAALALLAVVWLAFQVTEIDLCCQDPLYSAATHSWLVPKSQPWPRLILYKWPKYGLIAFGVWLAASLAVPESSKARRYFSKRTARELWYLLLCLGLFPAAIAGLKNVSGVDCPSALTRYGGTRPYRAAWEPTAQPPQRPGRCFPAGHASGGFALLGLACVARSRRQKRLALGIGLGAGWAMGLYQMFNGSHFLSHTVITMLLAWIFTVALALLFRLPESDPSRPANHGSSPGTAR